jgi:hypothetical protein
LAILGSSGLTNDEAHAKQMTTRSDKQ